MLDHPLVIQFAVFASVSASVSLVYFLLTRGDALLQTRLSELNDIPPSILNLETPNAPRSKSSDISIWGRLQGLVPGSLWRNESQESKLRLDFVRAGLYEPAYRSAFTIARLLLMAFPLLLCVLSAQFLRSHGHLTIIISASIGCLGFMVPGMWLKWRINRQQSNLRQALPDFLDIIVVCLEGGLSFEAALQRTTDELQSAHPILARELAIVQREIAIGRAVADALQNMAERTGLNVVKTLAANVRQARRLGIRLAENLRTQAVILRTQREQRAEELAQKAAVKILFPTLIFIFPTIFVVIVGPAVFQIQEMIVESPADDSGNKLPNVQRHLEK